mgnify:CR=1 FL=1
MNSASREPDDARTGNDDADDLDQGRSEGFDPGQAEELLEHPPLDTPHAPPLITLGSVTFYNINPLERLFQPPEHDTVTLQEADGGLADLAAEVPQDAHGQRCDRQDDQRQAHVEAQGDHEHTDGLERLAGHLPEQGGHAEEDFSRVGHELIDAVGHVAGDFLGGHAEGLAVHTATQVHHHSIGGI